MVVMDVGDVLIRTIPMAHYQALAGLTGLPWEQVRAALESSGARLAFATGGLTEEGFATAAGNLLGCPGIGVDAVREAWNALIANPDPVVCPITASLAGQDRLLLASNTDPFHWQLVVERLAAVGIDAPAHLSFNLGFLKPDHGFFSIVAADPRVPPGTLYVDDRIENVEAAEAAGFKGWVHSSPGETAAMLAGELG